MTRTRIVLILVMVAVAVAAAGWFLTRRSPPPASLSGYVEAEYVMVGSAVGGPLLALDVARGDHVRAGAQLFALDDISERGARDEAKGKLQQAQAQLADLLTGRRPAEIDAILAQRTQAEAALQQSEAEFKRQARLQTTGVSSVQSFEQARMQRDRDKARIEELNAQLRVARLPGRDEQVNAAEAAVLAAQGTLAQAEWRLTQKVGLAPVDAVVVDTLYRPGETVAAGAPVVQLLPPANIKVRFFVPETRVPDIAVGDKVMVSCDGCGDPIPAAVSFISPQAEFTPPVIYSREQRSRLVFLVEALPTERPERLRVGQPIDVTPARP